MNTDLLGLELRLAQAQDPREREQVVAHALNVTPHDPWWLFVAARLVESRNEPAGDALAMLVQRVKAHLLGGYSCPPAEAREETQAVIDDLPDLMPWAAELLRWVWTREAANALAESLAADAAADPALARSLINRALALPAPGRQGAAGDFPAGVPAEQADLRMRWIAGSLWCEALCMAVRIELALAQPDAWSVSQAMECLSELAAQDAVTQETACALLADIPLAAHGLAQWRLRRDLPEDTRLVTYLSRLRTRFRRALPADLEAAREAAIRACQGQLARCEMLRTYLDTQEQWRVHDGDLLLPQGILQADESLIVTGDLVCDAWTDRDTVVIVLGSLRCGSMYSHGGLCVVGDVIARGIVLQHYNDWAFEVLGKFSARALVSLDKSVKVDASRTVTEYSPWAPLNALTGSGDVQRASSAWLAIDPERDVDEQIGELMAMEAAGLDPLPPAGDVGSRKLSEFDARQRAIAEGRLDAAEALALSSDAAWAWELVTLLSEMRLENELHNRLLSHADARVRCVAVARLTSDAQHGFAGAVQDADEQVRAQAALHAACPESLWAILANDADARVRAAWIIGRILAGATLPPEWVVKLAEDADPVVRRALAAAPGLPTTVTLRLLADEDESVRVRAGRSSRLSVELLQRMAEDPSPSVRLALAGMAYDWRAPFDQHPGLARHLREKLVRDADPAVRRAAAFGLTPPFVEAHGNRFSIDPVVEVRRLIAACSRELDLQKRLLADDDPDVRRALAGNPHAHEDVLMELARTLPAGSLFEPDSSLDELAPHPRLTEEAIRLLHERVSNDHGHLFDEQPLAPLDIVVARLVHDHPFEPGDEEYAAYEGLRKRFPALAAMHEVMADEDVKQGWPRRLMEAGITYPRRWYHRIFFTAGFVALTFSMMFRARRKVAAAQSRGEMQPLSEADLDAIAQAMLESPVYAIRTAILGNHRCPPAALAEYVRQYLASRGEPDAPSDYTIRQVVANPALPLEAMGQVVAHLCRADDYELRTGIMRNRAMSEALFTQLLAASSAEVREAAREGLWRVHGEWVE